MADISCYRPIAGVRYLDEIQDEAYARSSLHGDSLIEAESRMPVRSVAARRADGYPAGEAASAGTLSLSGTWRMKGGAPADPGDPPPNTGWFGRKATAAEGMEEGWYKPGCNRSGWHEVKVPGTVQKALLELGLMKDPFWNSNMLDELEEHGQPPETPVWFRRTPAETRDWWFARSFELPGEWQGRRLTLSFEGIDYSATVFVNGVSLGHHKGMFGGPELDITGLALFGAPNEVVVRVDQAPQSWNGLLKGSPGFGWHYGHLISMGIWREVLVRAEAELKVTDPYVATVSISPDEAVLAVEYSVISSQAEPVPVIVEGIIRRQGSPSVNGSVPGTDGKSGEYRFSNEVTVSYGVNRVRTEVCIPCPSLWWPSGYGEQALYRLELSPAADGAGTVSEAYTVFGIRTIEMLPAAASEPEAHYRWQFVINGVPMFIKGANWCWPDPLLEQRGELYERLLELARRGHVGMLRAWGGGLVEGDMFYRLCDEKGIMVYQEFPLCWGPPDSPHTDLGVIDRQVTGAVKRLRNHPSLVMWGGGNENGPHGGADEGLFLTGRRCRGFDPSRPFHRTDPWGGSVHNWHVYHGGEPLAEATLAMPSVFYGEFGIPSMPDRSSCLRFIPEEELGSYPPTEDSRGWKAHFHQFGLKDIIKVMRYGAYGPIRSWDDYIRYSQTAQGDSIRFTADMQRAQSGGACTGFWYYKLTDLFPGHSWGIVDFYGSPKLSYYRAKQSCRPENALLTFAKTDGWKAGERFAADLYAVSDTLAGLAECSVTVTLYNSQLTAMETYRHMGLRLKPGTALHIGSLSMELPSEEQIHPFIAAVTLRAENGSLLSDQWYFFNAQSKPEELLAFERSHLQDGNEYPGEEAQRAFELYANLKSAPLLTLPPAVLEWEAERTADGGAFRIRNTGTVPAVRVTIFGFPEEWSCFLEDNDFGLQPGEERRVPYTAGADISLEGVTLSAWNAAAVPPASVEGIARNERERRNEDGRP